MAALLATDDPRYARVCGTYGLEDGRHVFIGGLLGSSVLTLHDCETQRIGTLALVDEADDQLVLCAGPSLWKAEPAEVTCAFPLGSEPSAALGLRDEAAALRGTRVPVVTQLARFTNGDVTLAGTLFLPPEDGKH
ncbi:MAG TPA: hypothetical protein VFN74_18325 [Chloroflexota bacterium]|nr:hypothetical protein [Chloroflexota bacterium]